MQTALLNLIVPPRTSLTRPLSTGFIRSRPPSLPLELIYRIALFHTPPICFHERSNDLSQIRTLSTSTYPEFSRDTLVNCMLVCKSWNEVLQPLAYRRVDLLINSGQQTAASSLSFRNQLQRIKENKHISDSVKFISLRIKNEGVKLEGEEWKELFQGILDMLSICPELTGLEMVEFPLQGIKDKETKEIENFWKRVGEIGLESRTAGGQAVLLDKPGQEDVEFKSSETSSLSELLEPESFSSLASLSFNLDRNDLENFANFLSYNETQFPNLKILKITLNHTFTYPSDSLHFLSGNKLLSLIARSFPSLTVLQVPSELVDVKTSMNFVFPLLLILSISQSTQSEDSMKSYILSEQHIAFPSLKKLQLTNLNFPRDIATSFLISGIISSTFSIQISIDRSLPPVGRDSVEVIELDAKMPFERKLTRADCVYDPLNQERETDELKEELKRMYNKAKRRENSWFGKVGDFVNMFILLRFRSHLWYY